MDESKGFLISATQVRERFGGVSDMWLHRRLHDQSGFPKPVYIGRLRFWRLNELRAWEEGLPREKPSTPALEAGKPFAQLKQASNER